MIYSKFVLKKLKILQFHNQYYQRFILNSIKQI